MYAEAGVVRKTIDNTKSVSDKLLLKSLMLGLTEVNLEKFGL